MGTTIELEAADGHRFSAYRADPAGKPRGGVLVIQEIFGVNAHIRSVCDGYAADGYLAIAPALFDRVDPGVELGYEGEAMKRGVEIVMQLKPRDALADMQAGVDELAKSGKVGVVGYCYGGTMAWAAASRLERVAAASCYYGGQIARQKDAVLKAPVILHFGEQDAMIPISDIDAIRAAHPSVPIYVYPAGHGFNRDVGAAYHAESAALAKQRTLELFRQHVG
jgi:carboxymethylenebutenolidase